MLLSHKMSLDEFLISPNCYEVSAALRCCNVIRRYEIIKSHKLQTNAVGVRARGVSKMIRNFPSDIITRSTGMISVYRRLQLMNMKFSLLIFFRQNIYILFWTNSRVVSIFYLIALAVAESFRLARMQQRGERLTKLCFVWHCSSSGIGWCTLIIICCVCALLY